MHINRKFSNLISNFFFAIELLYHNYFQVLSGVYTTDFKFQNDIPMKNGEPVTKSTTYFKKYISNIVDI